MEDEDFDWQAYLNEHPPDPAKIRRGLAAHKERIKAAMSKKRPAVRVEIDEDVFQQFSKLVEEGQSCEQLINQALRQWLAADGIREMPAEIQPSVQQSLSSAQLLTEKAAA